MSRNFILFCFGCVCSFVLLGFLPHCFYNHVHAYKHSFDHEVVSQQQESHCIWDSCIMIYYKVCVGVATQIQLQICFGWHLMTTKRMCYIYSFWGIVSYLAIASSPSQKIPPTVMYDIKNHRKICMPSTHYRGVFARICQIVYNNSIYIIHVTIMIWRSKNHYMLSFCVASVEKT